MDLASKANKPKLVSSLTARLGYIFRLKILGVHRVFTHPTCSVKLPIPLSVQSVGIGRGFSTMTAAGILRGLR